MLALARDDDVDGEVRERAAEALGKLEQTDEAVQACLELARDDDVDGEVRERAAEALGELGQTDEAVQILLALARDEKVKARVRKRAAEALGNLGQTDKVVQAYLALARDDGVGEEVRERAAEALGKLGQMDGAIQILRALARDEKVNAWVRRRAAEALGELGQTEESAQILWALARDEYRGVCIGADSTSTLAAAESRQKHKDATDKESVRRYNISVAHPKLLAKKYASLCIVQIYLESMYFQVRRMITREFGAQKVAEHEWDIELEKGLKIRIKLYSPVLSFSDPVVKQVKDSIITARFIVIPEDNCQPGIHSAVLSITNAETQIEYESISFPVQVIDFAFDHISRPLLSKMISAVLGLGSLAMFALTALEQIDKTFGLTAGTATAVLTSTVLIRLWALFQKPKVVHDS